jgi:hypothetical protein
MPLALTKVGHYNPSTLPGSGLQRPSRISM